MKHTKKLLYYYIALPCAIVTVLAIIVSSILTFLPFIMLIGVWTVAVFLLKLNKKEK